MIFYNGVVEREDGEPTAKDGPGGQAVRRGRARKGNEGKEEKGARSTDKLYRPVVNSRAQMSQNREVGSKGWRWPWLWPWYVSGVSLERP